MIGKCPKVFMEASSHLLPSKSRLESQLPSIRDKITPESSSPLSEVVFPTNADNPMRESMPPLLGAMGGLPMAPDTDGECGCEPDGEDLPRGASPSGAPLLGDSSSRGGGGPRGLSSSSS